MNLAVRPWRCLNRIASASPAERSGVPRGLRTWYLSRPRVADVGPVRTYCAVWLAQRARGGGVNQTAAQRCLCGKVTSKARIMS